jgi:hypothetical protein
VIPSPPAPLGPSRLLPFAASRRSLLLSWESPATILAAKPLLACRLSPPTAETHSSLWVPWVPLVVFKPLGRREATGTENGGLPFLVGC